MKKLAKTQNPDQKEDGEISDDNDDSVDDDDDYRVLSASPVHQRRKQIVYEIDDDSYSSSGSGQNSPYNSYSGEELSKHNKYWLIFNLKWEIKTTYAIVNISNPGKIHE